LGDIGTGTGTHIWKIWVPAHKKKYIDMTNQLPAIHGLTTGTDKYIGAGTGEHIWKIYVPVPV
jgi:hypothetical protein